MANNRKFIAFLVNDIEADEDCGSAFYISDLDYYNNNGCISDEFYSGQIYDAIESLGKGCFMAAENYFMTDEKLGGERGLREFLKSLPWIKVISEKAFNRHTRVSGADIEEVPADLLDEDSDELENF